ncbi:MULTISPECIES: hypothetical protein [Streptomyces]|uniref:hypothetical protein n=1 Tax=Streptomyces TaxID=1883 RepID=UPI000851E5A5|nr:hypothetical protein [Streptomyces sp. EN16]
MKTRRPLPSVTDTTEAQQRGWACVWCRALLGIGLGVGLGQQRVTPATGAAYLWFPRQCSDTVACLAREAS